MGAANSMVDKPKVSFYVPNYNMGKYIRFCLDSILEQTWPNMEILISDDASTDGSLDICKEYAQMDSRIRLFERDKPHGSGGDINDTLAEFDGDFACMMDPDDVVMPRYWETVLPFFSKPKIGFVCVGLVHMSKDGDASLMSIPPLRISNYIDLFGGNRVFSASPFRMEMFRELGGFDMGHPHNDWDFWIRAALAHWEWTTCVKPVYYYRRHPEALLATMTKEDRFAVRDYYRTKYAADMDRLGMQPGGPESYAIGVPKVGVLDPTSRELDPTKEVIDAKRRKS
jgi:glycosyltransferase involved in cell wall biosynthesis